MDSFTLGKGYFGNYGSEEGSRSTTYKQRIKEKITNIFYLKAN